MITFNFKKLNKQDGVTLIEALVSLFIFSIGALGVAALQTSTLVRSDDTKQRSIAIWKAQELVDRVRSTKTVVDPDGSIAIYLAAFPNGSDDVGVMTAGNEYVCPANVPQRCDEQDGTVCSADQMVAFDIWSVMCDPSSGLAVDNPGVGSVGLRNVELSISDEGGYYNLYFEWLSRSANNDTDLQADDGSVRTVSTNLCGDDFDVDTRLDAYCVRFQ